MHTDTHIYHHGEQALHGYLAVESQDKNPRPAVLVVHDWSGRNEFACQKAELLASLGYVGFAVDMYGEAALGESVAEKQALMQPILGDRRLLRDRMSAALDALMGMPMVDKHRIAVIGFCFGGLCALDLARTGAPIAGAVSFHGILAKPEALPNLPIKAKILVLHGYDDPMVSPNDVNEFCKEMTLAKVDWQVAMYGHTQHAFMNPAAHDKALGTVYNAQTESRAWALMRYFLQELFSSPSHAN